MMRPCMHVAVHACKHVCAYTHACTYAYICVCVWVHVCTHEILSLLSCHVYSKTFMQRYNDLLVLYKKITFAAL